MSWPSAELELFLAIVSHYRSRTQEARDLLGRAAHFILAGGRLANHSFHPYTLRAFLRLADSLSMERAWNSQIQDEICLLDPGDDVAVASPLRQAEILAQQLVLNPHIEKKRWRQLCTRSFSRAGPTWSAAADEAWENRLQEESWLQLLGGCSNLGPWRELILDALRRLYYTTLLLLCPRADAGDAAWVACTLPVRIDVLFDGRGGNPKKCVDMVVDKPIQIRPSFTEAVNRAYSTACVILNARRGGWPMALRQDFLASTLVVDFALAVTVARQVGNLLGDAWALFPLEDTSASLPIALAGMSRLNGQRFDGTVVATGPVGEVHERMDAPVAWTNPSDEIVRAKLDLARRFLLYDRIILPENTPTDALRRLSSGAMGIHPVTVPLLTVAMDAWSERPWRKTWYVRAPEWQWKYHDRQTRTHMGDILPDRLQCLGRAFWRNQCVNVWGPQGSGKSQAILETLLILRNQMINHTRTATPTWLYFRCTAEEHGERFFRSLLTTISAHPDDAHDFFKAPDWESKAERLAAILNDFSPTQRHPRKFGPNVLILDGIEGPLRQVGETYNPRSDLYDVAAILQRAIPLLGGHPSEDLEHAFGQVRLVLEATEPLSWGHAVLEVPWQSCSPTASDRVPQAGEEVLDAALTVPHTTGSAAEEILLRLSIFRFGFTKPGAIAVLDQPRVQDGETSLRCELAAAVRGGSCRVVPVELDSVLRDLLANDVLRVSSGRYHLRPETQAALYAQLAKLVSDRTLPTSTSASHTLGLLHLRCAWYFVPHLASATFPGLLPIESFLPHNIFEAEYHLDCARRLGSQKVAGLASASLGKLSWCFFEAGIVRASRFERLGLIADAIGDWDTVIAEHPRPHPRWLLAAAQQRTLLIRQQNHAPDNQKQLLAETSALIKRSYAATNDYPGEREVNIGLCHSSKANMQLQVALDVPWAASMGDSGCQIVRWLIRRKIAAAGDLYERAGDYRLEHGNRQAAGQFYGAGTEFVPAWAQNWFKAAGVSADSGREAEAAALIASFCGQNEGGFSVVSRAAEFAVRFLSRQKGKRRPSMVTWIRGLHVAASLDMWTPRQRAALERILGNLA